tara:strand:- start:1687 stop:3123 length:1437 start_codon:yes stop_codon:yes gene_type:complete
MNEDTIVPVILCGGKGSRLWPLSRATFPKQFLSLIQNTENSFLQETIQRLNGIKNISQPLIICNEEHRFIVAEQMRQKEIKPNEIFLEPFGRNTAPAIALAAINFINKGYDPHLLVLSSDHLIRDKEKFREVIDKSVKHSKEEKIVTFGIPPSYPETGYGYIKTEKDFNIKSFEALNIDCFIEKPDFKTAKELILDKKYLWNSGIFIFKATVIIKEIMKYCPEVFLSCSKALEMGSKDLEFKRIDKELFAMCPNISIDKSIMEKTQIGAVMPMSVGWSDVGNWDSLWKESEKDKHGNVISGNVFKRNTENCLIKSETRLAVALGLRNLAIIETNDALLVASKNDAQEVKEIVKILEEQKRPEANIHKKVFRPWGNFISIESGLKWQVKRIEVNPKSSLSLQMHKHRAEHWVVVTGTANVQIDKKTMTLSENESTYIPVGSKHRLENKTDKPLIIIEVQSGNYFGEDDIIRFKDSYGRK